MRDPFAKRDAARFKHEIAPKLDVLQPARASAVAKVPHPSHWDMLEALIKLQWVVESRRVGLHEAPCRK
jgi:hypothetical protein